jgi:hypothetical protein
MKYSPNVDLLVATIVYLGTHSYYWGRTPNGLAEELGLDSEKLLAVFEGFPGLYRRTKRTADNGQHYYALQARHAQRKGGKMDDPDGDQDIAPLAMDKLNLLIEFVLQMTEHENAARRAWWTGGIAAGAAIVSAITAISVAYMTRGGAVH